MNIEKMLDEYAAWLRSEISADKIGEYYEITTPYLDNANDYLQIYVKVDGDDVFLTDDGATIQNLKMNGFQFNPGRKVQLARILRQYGVSLDGTELIAKAQVRDFAKKKHLLIQAMLRVDDMFLLSKSRVASLFLDDVQEFFDEKEIYYSDNVQFAGKSGFAHTYDFLLQRSKNRPERLCQAINNPNRTNMSNVLFAWNDTKPARKNDSQLIILLNDQNAIGKGIEEGFSNYDAKVIRWSERYQDKNLSLLSAS